MTLKRRIEKLEPSAHRAWERAWNATFETPEASLFDDKSRAYVQRLKTMTEQDHVHWSEQLEVDQKQYPALIAWDHETFIAWSWEFDRWLNKVNFDWSSPNLVAWPWLAPEPPDIPLEVMEELEQAAGRSVDLADFYAYTLFQVAAAQSIKRSIRDYGW